MKDWESFLRKHAKSIVNPDHLSSFAQGINFNGEGRAYLSDGILAVRLSGLPEIGFSYVEDLNGKPMDVEAKLPERLNRLFDQEMEGAVTVSTKELQQAADLHTSLRKAVQGAKAAKEALYRVDLQRVDGALRLSHKTEEISGYTVLAERPWEDWPVQHVAGDRLLAAAKLFAEDYETVNLEYRNRMMIRLSAGNLEAVLLGIRVYD
ncbi:hypothetical protein [Sporosarcina trichiuri]|uniref:hypothetical protein n=1 Tax=Sporosarcina trichiuri TaxID=3056445 RepID=UPI0025B36EA1|nr:hypothetical protein [Sporosarcina sp. 0.2-SM1T-5]WJY27438.1 hypothetical protein QWT68_15575 [Sporosarcina sp. 0.2-SM1T-5]WJY27458.1 hypothetical protein QWT68_00095 [Sporosarcina sp. 0.2-SM1T-5]